MKIALKGLNSQKSHQKEVTDIILCFLASLS